MTTHLSLQRMLLPTAQVSSLTTGSITLPGARGAFDPPAEDFELISSTSALSSTYTFDVSTIGTTYSTLIFYAYFAVHTGNQILIRFNGDTSSNYYNNRVYNNAFAGGSGSSLNSYFSTAAEPMLMRIVLPDFASTSKKKSFLWTPSVYNTGSPYLGHYAGLWQSNSAITSISFTDSGSSNFTTNSKVSLYGLKK